MLESEAAENFKKYFISKNNAVYILDIVSFKYLQFSPTNDKRV